MKKIIIIKYAPAPSSLSVEISSHEMYGEISDLASIPRRLQEYFSLIMHLTRALSGFNFAVHENLAVTVIFSDFFGSRLTVKRGHVINEKSYMNLDKRRFHAAL